MSASGHLRYRLPWATKPPSPKPARRNPRAIARSAVDWASGLYAAGMVILWAVVRLSPADSWQVHLLLYGPRWMLSLPALALGPPAVFLSPRRAAPALALAVLALAAFWGFNVPWGTQARGGEPTPETLRVLSCNVQRSDLRAHALADLIRSTRPDVVLLQEWGGGDPTAVFGREGWHILTVGEFCLASRYPISDLEPLRRLDKRYRVIAARAWILRSDRMIPIISVHLMSPRAGLDAVIHSRIGGLGTFQGVAALQRSESAWLRDWARESGGDVILAGDFNLTGQHPLYRRDWGDFEDAFERVGWGLGNTFFTRHIGLRIDHVLGGEGWRATSYHVGPDVGSAHRPVIADLSR